MTNLVGTTLERVKRRPPILLSVDRHPISLVMKYSHDVHALKGIQETDFATV